MVKRLLEQIQTLWIGAVRKPFEEVRQITGGGFPCRSDVISHVAALKK